MESRRAAKLPAVRSDLLITLQCLQNLGEKLVGFNKRDIVFDVRCGGSTKARAWSPPVQSEQGVRPSAAKSPNYPRRIPVRGSRALDRQFVSLGGVEDHAELVIGHAMLGSSRPERELEVQRARRPLADLSSSGQEPWRRRRPPCRSDGAGPSTYYPAQNRASSRPEEWASSLGFARTSFGTANSSAAAGSVLLVIIDQPGQGVGVAGVDGQILGLPYCKASSGTPECARRKSGTGGARWAVDRIGVEDFAACWSRDHRVSSSGSRIFQAPGRGYVEPHGLGPPAIIHGRRPQWNKRTWGIVTWLRQEPRDIRRRLGRPRASFSRGVILLTCVYPARGPALRPDRAAAQPMVEPAEIKPKRGPECEGTQGHSNRSNRPQHGHLSSSYSYILIDNVAATSDTRHLAARTSKWRHPGAAAGGSRFRRLNNK